MERNRRLPKMSEMNTNNGLPNRVTFEKHVGITPNDYGRNKFDSTVAPQFTEAKCKEAYDRFVEKHGRLPKQAEMTRGNGLPDPGLFKKYVGCTPFDYGNSKFGLSNTRTLPSQLTESECMEDYDRFVEEHGRLPKITEMNRANGLPDATVFKKHVGCTPLQYGSNKFGMLAETIPPTYNYHNDNKYWLGTF